MRKRLLTNLNIGPLRYYLKYYVSHYKGDLTFVEFVLDQLITDYVDLQHNLKKVDKMNLYEIPTVLQVLLSLLLYERVKEGENEC